MSNTNISDEDALRELVASAERREQERSSVSSSGKPSRFGKRESSWSQQDTSKRRRQEGGRGRRNDDNDNNASYYGPPQDDNDNPRRRRHGSGANDDNERRNQRRQRWGEEGDSHRDRERRPNRVEREDHDNNKVRDEEKDGEKKEKPPPQEKPNFGLSGALAKDTSGDGSGGGGGNMYKGVVLKFQEPPEARTPNTQWRFYVFKGKELLETLHISKQSAYLLGRNTDIADIPILHPSLSSQHAVLQYRAMPLKENPLKVSCQPYIMDLESTNGTFINTVRIDSARYYQLRRGDVLTFGASKREYVLMTENTTSVK